MTEILMELVPDYGLFLIGLVTFLSCLAVPLPSSLLMVVGGAFAASGDLNLWWTGIAAFTGAILGDQLGYQVGLRGGGMMTRLQQPGAKHADLLQKASDFSARWGGLGVFLSRWLISPLGPYVNFIAGATGLGWIAFTLGSLTGEAIWVGIYTGLGFVFSNQIEMVTDIAGNISGFLAAGVLAIGLGIVAFRPARNRHRTQTGAE